MGARISEEVKVLEKEFSNVVVATYKKVRESDLEADRFRARLYSCTMQVRVHHISILLSFSRVFA